MSDNLSILGATVTKAVEDFADQLMTMAESHKKLCDVVEDLAKGMVGLSQQMDILKDWLSDVDDRMTELEKAEEQEAELAGPMRD